MQDKAAYSPLWWCPFPDTAHSGSFSAPSFPFITSQSYEVPRCHIKHLNHAKNNEHSQKILLHGEFPLHCSSLSSASLSSVQLAEDVRKLDRTFNPRPWRLGYDSTSDDYKILKTDDAARCEILTLKSGSWRKIDKRPAGVFPVLSDTEDSMAFVHGAFRWLDSSLEKTLISFSISNEVYGEITLPEGTLWLFKQLSMIHGDRILVCQTW
ncbi:hypothetical protein BC332_31509 [Capsicum chinense]|nr:hypothetical protein BC332_31509 [Capsicum chinense]